MKGRMIRGRVWELKPRTDGTANGKRVERESCGKQRWSDKNGKTKPSNATVQ